MLCLAVYTLISCGGMQMHIGPGNTSMNYEMGGTILSTTVKEKDLGVTMDAASMRSSG